MMQHSNVCVLALMGLTLLVLFGSCGVAGTTQKASLDGPSASLRPDGLLENQMLKIGHVTQLVLHGLQASRQYELRLCYPASMPAVFEMELQSDDLDHIAPTSRTLLNTEILRFTAGSSSSFSASGHHPAIKIAEQEGQMLVKISVEQEGVTYMDHLLDRPVQYDLILDTLHWGISARVFPLIYLLVVCLALSLLVANNSATVMKYLTSSSSSCK